MNRIRCWINGSRILPLPFSHILGSVLPCSCFGRLLILLLLLNWAKFPSQSLLELFSLTPPFPSYYTAAGSWHGPAPSLPFFSSPFQSPNPPGENMETRLEARQGTGGGPCGLTEEGREGVFPLCLARPRALNFCF